MKKPGKGRSVRTAMWLLIAYGALMIFFGVCLIAAGGMEGVYHSIGVYCGLIVYGALVLLLYRKKHFPEDDERSVVIRESSGVNILGIIVVAVGVFLLFAGTVLGLSGDMREFWGFTLFGWAILSLAVLVFLAYRNRRIILENGGRIVCVGLSGRVREFHISEAGRVKLNLNGELKVMDRQGRMMFRFEGNMANSQALIDLLVDRNVPFAIKNAAPEDFSLEEGEEKAVNLELEYMKWNKEDETWQSRHVKAIRSGGWLLTVLVGLGCGASLFLLLGTAPKAALCLIACLPLLMYVYYMIFCHVLVWGDKPNSATREWKEKHVPVPWLFWVVEALVMVFFADLSDRIKIVDGWRFFFLCLAFAALLGGLCMMRMPKRLKRPGNIILLWACVLICCFPVGYAVNFSAGTKVEHYPLEVVELRAEKDDEGMDYYVKFTLEDGSDFQLKTDREDYRDLEYGKPMRVCERASVFGIRTVTVHQ